MGFCLFNNVAVAARHALDALGRRAGARARLGRAPRQRHQRASSTTRAEVLFASIHQWPFYPGTGPLADVGAGAGEGYTINLPVPAGPGEGVWLSLVEHVVMPAARAFRPDCARSRPATTPIATTRSAACGSRRPSFARMARHVRALADELGAPVGAVLEGGYDLSALASRSAATMEALAKAASRVEVARHRWRAAAEQVGRYWEPDVGTGG